jgi:hypothetical protein
MEGDEVEGRGSRQGGGLAAGGAANGARADAVGAFGSESGNIQRAGSGNARNTAGYVFPM